MIRFEPDQDVLRRFDGAAWVMPAWRMSRAEWIGLALGAAAGLVAGALAAWGR